MEEIRFSLPYGANGWQLCMGCFGIAQGAGLLWPQLTGGGSSARLLATVGLDPPLWGAVVLLHGVAAVMALFAFGGRGYWCPMICALGALVWTVIGLSTTAIGLGEGTALPVWGLFEIVGGIGYSVSTVQRAREAVAGPEG